LFVQESFPIEYGQRNDEYNCSNGSTEPLRSALCRRGGDGQSIEFRLFRWTGGMRIFFHRQAHRSTIAMMGTTALIVPQNPWGAHHVSLGSVAVTSVWRGTREQERREEFGACLGPVTVLTLLLECTLRTSRAAATLQVAIFVLEDTKDTSPACLLMEAVIGTVAGGE
jgi:hypothetical protein